MNPGRSRSTRQHDKMCFHNKTEHKVEKVEKWLQIREFQISKIWKHCDPGRADFKNLHWDLQVSAGLNIKRGQQVTSESDSLINADWIKSLALCSGVSPPERRILLQQSALGLRMARRMVTHVWRRMIEDLFRGQTHRAWEDEPTGLKKAAAASLCPGVSGAADCFVPPLIIFNLLLLIQNQLFTGVSWGGKADLEQTPLKVY